MRKFPWAWVMPGGHIEAQETLEESVKRELFEETGIVLGEGSCRGKVEPYFVFESVSVKVRGVKPPFSGHLVLFFKVQIDMDFEEI